MKTCTRCGEIKPKTEFAKHPRGRNGLHPACKDCERTRKAEYRKANPEKVKATKATYRAANKDKIAAYGRATRAQGNERVKKWAAAHPEELKNRSAAYRANNKKACGARVKAWRSANPHKVNAFYAKRRASKLQATPPWADHKAIEEIYAKAQGVQALLGEPVHVDHIVPLQSRIVCGLHVPANLQILLGFDNSAKSNRYWPDMPG